MCFGSLRSFFFNFLITCRWKDSKEKEEVVYWIGEVEAKKRKYIK